MDNILLKSTAFKDFLKSILIGLLLAVLTFCLGFLPYDDLIQGVWIFLTSSMGAAFVLKKRTQIFEVKEERYRRVAQQILPIRLEEDPHLISTLLLGQDIPECWVTWIKDIFGIDFLQCRCYHAIDSFCYVGDRPAQGITRATQWITKVLYGLENETTEKKQEAVSCALEKLVEESQHILGEQFHPGFYYKKIEKGPLPYGIFIESQSKGAKALATSYQRKIIIRKKIQEIPCIRLGLNIHGLDEKQWKNLVEEIDRTFPWLDRKNLGDGPRSLTSQLFVQETIPVDIPKFEEKLKELPSIISKFQA